MKLIYYSIDNMSLRKMKKMLNLKINKFIRWQDGIELLQDPEDRHVTVD